MGASQIALLASWASFTVCSPGLQGCWTPPERKRNEILTLLSWFSLYVASIYEGDDLRKKLQTVNHFKYKAEADAEFLM